MSFNKFQAAGAALFMAMILGASATGQQSPKLPQPEVPPSPIPEEKQLIESLDGRLLFRAYCASCHGAEAKGNGPAAAALKTPPPDLTRISQRNGGKFPSARVQKIISGVEVASPHGSREMPIWGPIFGQISWDQDLGVVRIYNLTKYLESLQQK